MNYNGRCLIAGRTTGGKSTFARYLAAQMTGARVILANVKGKLDTGVEPVFDVASIDWGSRLINWIPPSMDRATFDRFYMAVWEHRGPPTVVWTDEAAAVTSPSYAPDGLALIQQQGAEWGMGHIVCSQRLKNVKMELRTEADELYVFVPPLSQADLQWVAEEISEVDGQPFGAEELRGRLRELFETHGPYSFLRWVRDTGSLSDCAPLDPAWVTAPLAPPETRRDRGGVPASRGDETALDLPG